MKQLAIKTAVLAALGIMTAPAMATNLVSVPTSGFSVSAGPGQPTGGTSAYTLCNTTGNFGSDESTEPTTGANNDCAVFPSSSLVAPESGYTLGRLATRNLVYNGVTIASVLDYIWRNSGNGMCIFGTRWRMANADYNTTASGTQYFEINDFARKGFSGRTDVTAGYYYTSVSDEVVFRIGRTYTAVQHRADLVDDDDPASGYYAQPLSYASASTAAINGLSTYTSPLGVPTMDQQSAKIDGDWVNFTTDNNWLDDDGTSLPDSSLTYVKTACTSVPSTTTANAYSFRQTGQEEAPLIEVLMSGYVPN